MLVGFSSIVNLFSLILIGIKNINSSSEVRFIVIDRKITAVKVKLDEIRKVSKHVFELVESKTKDSLTNDELQVIFIKNFEKIESLLDELYRQDLIPILNLITPALSGRIYEMLGAKKERRLRILERLVNDYSNDTSEETIHLSVEAQGRIILETLDSLSKKYEDHFSMENGVVK